MKFKQNNPTSGTRGHGENTKILRTQELRSRCWISWNQLVAEEQGVSLSNHIVLCYFD